MRNILLRIPSYSVGNVGDAALIKTLERIYKNDNIINPNSENELNKVDLSKIDILIYFGNDCIPYYGISTNIINKCLSLNKKVHIINTSWGAKPREDNLKFLKNICKSPNLQIYIRDSISFKLIQEDINFLNPPILTADLAFLCDKNETNKNNELEKWINKTTKPIIGINIHQDFCEYNSDVKTKIINFVNTNHHKYRFLFIPHDSRKREYQDLISIQKTCKNVDSFTTNYLEPEYEKFITSKLYLVITGRMHLSILTIPNGIPSIAIAYNGVKAIGTFSHWDIENLVIEPKNIGNLTKLVTYVEENYSLIQKKINQNMESVKDKVNKQIF